MDPHSGAFGKILWDALAQYLASSPEPGLAEASKLLDTSGLSEEETYQQMLDWILERLAQ